MGITNLEYMYDRDKRALSDFVSCTSDCYDCRARPYCERFTALDGVMTEPEFLMAEMGNEAESIAEMRVLMDEMGNEAESIAEMREMFGKSQFEKEKQYDRA